MYYAQIKRDRYRPHPTVTSRTFLRSVGIDFDLIGQYSGPAIRPTNAIVLALVNCSGTLRMARKYVLAIMGYAYATDDALLPQTKFMHFIRHLRTRRDALRDAKERAAFKNAFFEMTIDIPLGECFFLPSNLATVSHRPQPLAAQNTASITSCYQHPQATPNSKKRHIRSRSADTLETVPSSTDYTETDDLAHMLCIEKCKSYCMKWQLEKSRKENETLEAELKNGRNSAQSSPRWEERQINLSMDAGDKQRLLYTEQKAIVSFLAQEGVRSDGIFARLQRIYKGNTLSYPEVLTIALGFKPAETPHCSTSMETGGEKTTNLAVSKKCGLTDGPPVKSRRRGLRAKQKKDYRLISGEDYASICRSKGVLPGVSNACNTPMRNALGSAMAYPYCNALAMSYEERKQLFLDIGTLPTEKAEKVFNFIAVRGGLRIGQEDVGIDFQALAPGVLREVKSLVASLLYKRPRLGVSPEGTEEKRQELGERVGEVVKAEPLSCFDIKEEPV